MSAVGGAGVSRCGAKPSGRAAGQQSTALDKTRLCKFYPKGECRRGRGCAFAHGEQELQSKPNLYRTELCIEFTKSGRCRFGVQCRFAHGPAQLRSPASERDGFIVDAGLKPSGAEVDALTEQALLTHQFEAALAALVGAAGLVPRKSSLGPAWVTTSIPPGVPAPLSVKSTDDGDSAHAGSQHNFGEEDDEAAGGGNRATSLGDSTWDFGSLASPSPMYDPLKLDPPCFFENVNPSPKLLPDMPAYVKCLQGSSIPPLAIMTAMGLMS